MIIFSILLFEIISNDYKKTLALPEFVRAKIIAFVKAALYPKYLVSAEDSAKFPVSPTSNLDAPFFVLYGSRACRTNAVWLPAASLLIFSTARANALLKY